MPIVEVNGQELEFPDDMPQEAIKAVLQKKFPTEQPAKPEGMESKAVRATMGALDPVFGVAQMVPHGLAALGRGVNAVIPNDYINGQMAGELAAKQDAMNKSREDWYQGAKAQDGIKGFDGMRMLGNVLSPMNAIPVKGAAMLPKATSLLGKVAQGALTGAASGAMTPVSDQNASFAENKLKQLGMGAALGGAIPVGGEMLARMIKPNVSKNVETLMQEGIRPTPGQILGGAFQKTEDKLTSIPLLGDAITKARQRGIEDSNIAVANRALEPIGEKVGSGVQAGRDLVNHVEGKLSDAYNTILPGMATKLDQQFKDEIVNIHDLAKGLGKDRAEQLQEIFKQEVLKEVSPNGTLTGEALKKVESVLGQKARGYLSAQHPDDRGMGQALREVQASLRSMVGRAHPAKAAELAKINEGWANFERMRGASSMLGAPEGIFSPAQLANNVKKMGGRNQYSRGDAMMQDLSDAAKAVLPSKYPDSGSIGRLMMGAGALGGGAYASPPTLAGLLLGAGMYSRPGIAALEAALAKRPQGAQAAANMVRKITSPSDLARLLMGASRAPSVPAAP